MKILIDTKEKVIKVEEAVNLGELIKSLKKLLPKDWEGFKLETNTEIIWNNPIIYDRWPRYPYYHKYPWYAPFTDSLIYGSSDASGNTLDITTLKDVPYTLTSGTYCVEV